MICTTRFTYDGQGRILSATDPLGIVTRNTYDSAGNLTSTIADYGVPCGGSRPAHLCQTTSFTYDALGDATSSTDPNGNTTTGTFDSDRRVTSLALPPVAGTLVTTYAYDPDGRLLQTQQSSGGTVLRTTRASYTLAGKVATSTDANGNTTRYAYDTVDRLSQIIDAVGRTTVFTYDPLSRPYQTFNLAVQAQPLLQYAYTLNGKLASLTDGHTPSGNTTAFAYDGFDRLGTTTYPDSGTEMLAYDADSNVLTRGTRAGQTITFTYDTLNRLATKAAPSEPTVTYGYDLIGRPTSVADNSAALPALPAGPASYAVSYSYDARDRLTGTAWPNVPAAVTPAAASVTFTHGYDPTNRRVSQGTTDRSWWYYPTVASATTYTANSLNQYSAVGSITPTYDGNGNLTFDGTFTYGYDAENRLISVKQGSTAVAIYAYDGQGRRKLKTVGSTSTIYVTDADNQEVLEYSGSGGQVQRWYSYGLGSTNVLNQMNVAANTRETMIPDIQGSILATLDSGSGALTKTGYRPYGESSGISGTFQYTGLRIDPETNGLYYARARMYSPAMGRFLQVDPIGYAGGVNLYAYTENDPLNLTDPSGNCPWCIGAVVGFGVDLGAQLLFTGTYDWRQGVAATVAGALTGGASAVIAKTVVTVGGRVLANAAVGGAVNAAQAQTLNAAAGQQNTVAGAAVLGAVGGAAGSYIGDKVLAASEAASQGAFDALSTAEKLTVLGFMRANPNLTIGAARPAAVVFGTAAGAAVGSVISGVPSEYVPSLISGAHAATPFSAK